jgi:acyl-CoA-dependent ceramide synthase
MLEKPGRRSKRRTIRRALSKWKRTCLRHTWLLPLIISTLVLALYLVNPVPSNPVSAALFLSYPLPRDPGSDADTPIHYGKGARDFVFVGFYVIVLSFTREFLMQRVIRPIALRYNIRNKAKQARFLEQFYTAVYFGIFGPFGLYVMSRTPVWYFNTRAMYEGFPHKTHEAMFKAYYLLQASYWAQQMIVLLLMLEKPRKDFKELVAHHFITLALIWCSYRFHFTYMGIAIYITMDISDFFLAVSLEPTSYAHSDFGLKGL